MFNIFDILLLNILMFRILSLPFLETREYILNCLKMKAKLYKNEFSNEFSFLGIRYVKQTLVIIIKIVLYKTFSTLFHLLIHLMCKQLITFTVYPSIYIILPSQILLCTVNSRLKGNPKYFTNLTRGNCS